MSTAASPAQTSGPQSGQVNPFLTRAEQRLLMYGAVALWVLISVFVVWQPYLLELPPVRTVVTLLLALPIAVFWFIFWPQELVARIAPNPYIQLPILLSGPVVLFLLFCTLIESPLTQVVAP